MGFRSTIVSEHLRLSLPDWFVDKWKDLYHFNNSIGVDWDGKKHISLPISSIVERKYYDSFSVTELFIDIQTVLKEDTISGINKPIHIVLLHECGGLSVVDITKDNITGREPTGWKSVDHVTHDYCYDCYKKDLT